MGVFDAERDGLVGAVAPEGAFRFMEEFRLWRVRDRVDAGVAEDAAGFAGAVEEEEGADAEGVLLSVRAVADKEEAVGQGVMGGDGDGVGARRRRGRRTYRIRFRTRSHSVRRL